MRVLVITKLFPNAVYPTHGLFNYHQFSALAGLCDELHVLATIPWYPGARWLARHSLAGELVQVPRTEVFRDMPVKHPRTLFLPKIGHGISGLLYAASIAHEVIRHRGEVDVIVGAWGYPDGCAAVLLGKMLGVPVVVKLHGSDINEIAEMPGPGRMMRWGLSRAGAVCAVSRALGGRAAALGVPEDRIDVVYNGCDTSLFRVRDRDAARAQLGRTRSEKMILYVGNTLRTKGLFDLLEAFDLLARRCADATLVVVGDGKDRDQGQRRASAINARHGADRVTFVGRYPHAECATWMAACDLLSLPSWNEGTPNVLLEAGASGRRVVATAVGGIPELMTRPIQGEMVEPRDVLGLAGALERVLYSAYDPVAVAAASRRWSWHDSARQLHGILERAIGAHQAVPSVRSAVDQARILPEPNSPEHRPVLAAR